MTFSRCTPEDWNRHLDKTKNIRRLTSEFLSNQYTIDNKIKMLLIMPGVEVAVDESVEVVRGTVHVLMGAAFIHRSASQVSMLGKLTWTISHPIYLVLIHLTQKGYSDHTFGG